MPTALPMPTKNPGDVLTSTLWNSYLRDNLNKLLNQGHRVLTVAQFAALTGLEGTKGTVAPDEVYLEVDSANGIQWHLAYESGEPTYKWRCIGGPPMRANVDTAEGGSTAAYADLATVGPSIIAPRSGNYQITVHANALNSAAGIGVKIAAKLGAAATADAQGAQMHSSGAGFRSELMRTPVLALLNASDVVKLQYFAGAATSTFQYRDIALRPERLS